MAGTGSCVGLRSAPRERSARVLLRIDAMNWSQRRRGVAGSDAFKETCEGRYDVTVVG